MIILFNKQKIYNFIFTLALVLGAFSLFNFGYNTTSDVFGVPLSGKIIIIDAGHGTPDSGTTGYSGSKEKDINLEYAKTLGKLLIKSGAHVIYTRNDDGTIADNLNDSIRKIKLNDMHKRKSIRDNSGADMFISIHMNYFSDPKYSGAQIFYRGKDNQSKLLANSIQKQIKEIADSSNTREAKDSKNDIFILNDSKVPAVLIECGFLSNPTEEQKLLTKSYREKMAFAIYTGIIKYLSYT